eukprot:scaffold4749_cov137-Isochrysis_galbana.AAC.4
MQVIEAGRRGAAPEDVRVPPQQARLHRYCAVASPRARDRARAAHTRPRQRVDVQHPELGERDIA